MGTSEQFLRTRFGLGPGEMGFSFNFHWVGHQVKKLCNCHRVLRTTVSKIKIIYIKKRMGKGVTAGIQN